MLMTVILLLVLRGHDKHGEDGQETWRGDAGAMDSLGAASGPDAGPAIAGHAEVLIAPEIQQRIGVTTAKVGRESLEKTIRTVGIVHANETTLAHIQVKIEGWIEKLYVTYTGQAVRRGDPLFAIYSPEFLTTQQDYLRALDNPALANAARERLRLWDVPEREIEELERTKKAQRTLTLRSEVEGTVIEKKAFLRQHVTPEEELYVIADLSTVWVEGKIYEQELAHVKVGQPAVVTLPALPDRQFDGKVAFVDPVVDEMARTAQVRVELPNRERLFRPGMFANVELAHSMGEALVVPASAIIRTGERNIAYRVADNRFVPVEVKLAGGQFGEHLQVVSGLQAGDVVVTSANFLIDSESRLRAGGGNMAGMAGMEMPGMDKNKGKGGDMKGMPMKGGGMKGMPMKGGAKSSHTGDQTEGGSKGP